MVMFYQTLYIHAKLNVCDVVKEDNKKDSSFICLSNTKVDTKMNDLRGGSNVHKKLVSTRVSFSDISPNINIVAHIFYHLFTSYSEHHFCGNHLSTL